MKRVYSASNSAEAHILKNMLDKQGIVANVQHEHSGFEGALPVTLWVVNEEDVERAKTIIEEFFSAK